MTWHCTDRRRAMDDIRAQHAGLYEADFPDGSHLCDTLTVLAALDAADADMLALQRLIVSYADLTHRVVTDGGDWRDIAKEWGIVGDESRAALAAHVKRQEERA